VWFQVQSQIISILQQPPQLYSKVYQVLKENKVRKDPKENKDHPDHPVPRGLKVFQDLRALPGNPGRRVILVCEDL